MATKTKIGASTNGANTASPGSSTNGPVNCSVCNVEPASDAIVKDHNYLKMITLYFESFGFDVKPAEFAKQSICTGCFDALVEFYDMNDILTALEQEFRKASLRILTIVEKGINASKTDNKPLTYVQKGMLERLPEVKKTLNVKLIKQEPDDSANEYTFRTFLKESKAKNANAESSDNNESGADSSAKETGQKRKRPAADPQPSPSPVKEPTRRLPARNKAKTPKYNDDESGASEDDDESVTTEKMDDDDEDDENKCKVCSETFPNKAEQIKHMREMHTSGKNKHPCTTCRKVFTKVNELMEHKKSCPTRRRGK
jgi:hypothetical protein